MSFDLFLGIWCVLFGLALIGLAMALLVQWIKERRARKARRNIQSWGRS